MDQTTKEPASRETALAVIEKAAKDGSLIFFDKNNAYPQVELYKTEVTVIGIDKDRDCFKINGKYMPNRSMVDRIGEASGIVFTSGDTKIVTVNDDDAGRHPIYIATAQGKVRMPDGTWRMSSVAHYEFDPTLRAMLDYKVTKITSETKNRRRLDDKGVEKTFGNTLAEAILEYQKTARQRANTGARLRVIRELVSMPISFSEEQIKKPVVFGRIVQNTSYILTTKEGRMMATAQALGVDMSGIFGGQKQLTNTATAGQDDDYGDYEEDEDETETAATAPAAKVVSKEPDFPDDPQETQKKESDFDRFTQSLIEWMEAYRDELDVTAGNGKNPYKMIEAELANNNATVETRAGMIARIRDWLDKKGIRL